jgi:hypothetical protein
MSDRALHDRSNILREEYNKSRQNVLLLTEQLEQAKNHCLTVTGHLNEVTYLISVEQKKSQSNGEDNGEVDNQTTE